MRETNKTLPAKRARKAAEETLRYFGITEPEEIDIEAIAMGSNVFIKSGRLSGADARLARVENVGTIRVSNEIQDRGRYRFSAAHEFGHWILHVDQSQVKCTSLDINPGYRTNGLENEANFFASELLMPHFMFLPRCGGSLSLHLAASLADTFSTSLTATAIRLVVLRNDCSAVIWSQSGSIKWHWGSASFGFWIDSRKELSSLSHVGRFFLKGTVLPVNPEPVPSHAWLNSDYCGPRRIFEHSLAVPRYNAVLSLIWI